MELGWCWLELGGIRVVYVLKWGFFGVVLECFWSVSGWILGGFGWILGGFEVDLGDVEKYLKMCRPRILIESARFPPFGFDITEMSSNPYENNRF